MTDLPRYALRHPDGRWLYYLPDPDRPPGERTGLFADGEPMNRLVPLADPKGNWYVSDRHAERITAIYQPRPKTVGYKLTDPKALSERYPAELSVDDWNERSNAHDEYWDLYDRITEDLVPVEHVYEGPFMPLEGRQPPAPNEPQWRAELPHELTQRAEYRHLFPGHIPGLKDIVAEHIKTMPKVQYCFVDYQGKPGIHVTVKVPFDPPRTTIRYNTDRRGRKLKSGRTVPVLVDRSLDLPVPAAVYGPNYETALVEWDRAIEYWAAQVAEASVAACSACDGRGYITPEAATPTISEARARLSAYMTHEAPEDEAEFNERVDAVVAAETAELREQVARVRSFAVSHEYRWLHELLDGFGTHGGHL
ncbi:hypothetical protein [Streptomyces javensis]|uniref:Uncharacterized protein n=1 Tax=Streptomyces javensis TaxID=114698 RepID=A0ABS0RBJ5_9ACTN|nr:hypothetical protein [Streptomyces javensis]MBI0314748.1 hypothetical protein [Streptomyces javensis]